ncbi:MAG: translocation/assembly module TamB domain-containing protein, partial [Bacteroidetes bacterium]|nr:translocation/assembly module TamB domain-containing protein [Bacteroidota bacterium]
MNALKTVLRIILYTTGGILLLLLLLAGFTQTQFFRDRLRAYALQELDSLLIAEVHLGDLGGNLVTGFTVDGVSLTLDGDTLLSAAHVALRYNLFDIPSKTISLQSIVLERPTVRLLRSRAGVWNLERMAAPTPPDTATSRFDWAVQLRRLDMRQGTIVLVDSTTLDEPEEPGRLQGALAYDDLVLKEFTLGMSFSMKDDVYRAGITRLAFSVDKTPVHVNHISGDIIVAPSRAEITDFRILTDSSNVSFSALAEGVDLLGGVSLEALQTCSTSVDLSVDPLNFGELGRILSPTDILHGSVTGSVRAAGPYGDLPVQEIDLRFGESRILMNGKVSNLHDPGNLALDIRMSESRIAPADPLQLLSGFDLPDFSSLGPVNLELRYQGTPLDFRTQLKLESEGGAVRTDDLALTIGGPQTLRYHGTVELSHVNLARVLDAESLATDLHGFVTLDGSGVDLRKLHGTVRARLDSSTFRGLAIRNAEAEIRARNRKVNGDIRLGIGGATYQFTGMLDESTQGRPTFSVEGTASAVNLAELLNEDRHESDLNLGIRLIGSGLTLGTLSGDFLFTATNSRYRSYPIEDGDIHLTLVQLDSLHKELTLSSPVLDANIEGAYDLGYLAGLMQYQLQNASLALGESFARFDSLFRSGVDTLAHAALREDLASDPREIDCTYRVKVKDLQLVSMAVGERNFNGVARLSGSLKGSLEKLTSDTRLAVAEFYYGDVASGVLVEDGEVVVQGVDLSPDRSYTDADLHVRTTARSVNISSTTLDSIEADVRLKGKTARYLVHGALNRDTRLSVQGEAQLEEDTISCGIEKMHIAHHEMFWETGPGAIVAISTRGIAVRDLVFRRSSARITAEGFLGQAGELSASVRATDLNLEDLSSFLVSDDAPTEERAFDGTLDAVITVGGSTDRPSINATFNADSIALRQIPFGNVRGSVGLAEGVLNLQVAADVTRGRIADGPELTVEGSIPLVRDDLGPQDKDREFLLTVKSAGTPITILDPILPNFNDLTGMLECDLTIAGTAARPRYTGTLSLSDCQFLFESNNMYYIVQGTFRGAGDRITVAEATIRNVPSDERDGRAGLVNLTGDFSLRNFKPGDFNLSATGQLHVVKEATRKSSLSMYGDLFVEIGRGGLRFTGNIESSLLRGALSISNSNLIFPPTQQVVEEESALSVPIIIYDDTTKYGEKAVLSAADRYFGSELTGAGAHRAAELEGAVSFLDGLRYDLDIDISGGTTSIRMVFNPISSEELVATIDGRFSITQDGRWWRGDLEVSRAYYNFYRRFDAEGRIQFTGDFMNPELDIEATYRGTRTVQD